jgi:hypothetical protein
MPNLRVLAKDDTRELNTADWGLPVKLTDPDGVEYTTDAITGGQLTAVQILYDYKQFSPATGEDKLMNEPIVVMHRASLSRVPQPGETWYMSFPVDPDPDTPEAQWGKFILSPTRAPEGGRSLGVIRLYPRKAVQS